MVVRKTAQLAWKTLPDSLHVRRTRHGDSEPALGPHGQPVVLLVGKRAVRVALLVGQRREHKSVGQSWATLKRDARKRGGHIYERYLARRTSLRPPVTKCPKTPWISHFFVIA